MLLKHTHFKAVRWLLLPTCIISASTSAQSISNVNIYGYLSWRVEKVFDELSIENGETVTDDSPREITIPSFNVMMQARVDDKSKVFINLDGEEGEDVTVANAWGEYRVNPLLNIRLGKSYRRFGLYNEILDAVPTYIGIEPPELFDGDHLILSRDTLAIVHGLKPIGDGEFRYSFSLDNGEGGASDEDNLPIGYDFRYEWGFGDYVIGTSGYSSGGDTTSDVEVGEGSPNTGVLPWMAADDFTVFGIYGNFQIDNLILQFAYWDASHDATRDPESVLTVVENAGINDAQRERFLLDADGPNTLGNIDTNGDYDITTWYFRAGYSFQTKHGQVQPYFQWDYYENPETIQNKDFGGDNEAGLSDDGKFTKPTAGVIFRPSPQLAVKLDFSTHLQKFNGKDESYPEVRFDVSYIFGN